MSVSDSSKTQERHTDKPSQLQGAMASARAAFRPKFDRLADRPATHNSAQELAAGTTQIGNSVDIEWRRDEPQLPSWKSLPPLAPKARQLLTAALIFLCGSIVGLGMAGLLGSENEGADMAAGNSAITDNFAQSSHSAASKERLPRGITPSELPYDGTPPQATSEDDESNKVAMLSESRHIKSDTGAQDDSSNVGRSSSTNATNATNASSTNARVSASAKNDNSDEASTGEREMVKNSAARPKDREIEGVRQQASGELKKEAQEVRARGKRETASKTNLLATKTEKTRKALAQCDRADSLFSREKCKWRLCNGNWGKYGCPSYRTQQPNYF